MRLEIGVTFPQLAIPRFLHDIVNVLDVLVSPHRRVAVPQRLESVVPVRNREEPVLEVVGKEVLIWEFVRGDTVVVVQERNNTVKGRLGRAEDDQARVEPVVSRARKVGGGEWSRESRLCMAAIFWDPVQADRRGFSSAPFVLARESDGPV